MKRIRFIGTQLGWAGGVSLTSLLAAWAAIAFLLESNAKLAIVFSVAAFVLDTLDGFLARKLGTASEFGRFLDSMVDAINYSVLAAVAVEQVLLPGPLGFAVGFLILAGGIVRLVLFTVNGFESEGSTLYYTGIVTPHLTLAVVLIYLTTRLIDLSEWLIAGILVVLALGQLSTVRTRKTGVLMFWIPASILIAVGAVIWL
ncbi:MAG: hypothetical protein RL196_1146 [Actinomycetota bacterium]